MKKQIRGALCLGIVCSVLGLTQIQAKAQEEFKILSGIYVEDMSLEGKTAKEAKAMIEEYVDGLSSKVITLTALDGNSVEITPSEAGLSWSNQEIINEAAQIGQKGNVVQRYKAVKDLQHENKVYKLEFDVDKDLVAQILAERCSQYNLEARDATLSRVDGRFIVNPGQTGQVVDEEASIQQLYDFLNNEWNRDNASLALVVKVDEPRGTEEELGKVKDVLGTFTTSFSTSGSSRSANVRNGCELINGATLYPGDEFSTYEAVAPFSQDNGYYMAGSYLNGQVVDSLGGGICQVSTTLYNAVLLSELEVTERHNHSMIVTYVDPSADAAIAESSGKDFRFVNNTEAPIYIEGVTTDDKHITFTIYGMETRPGTRAVRYESEVISKTYPDTEIIYPDASRPIGAVSVQSAHIGYSANLWKVVTENGVEVSREKINSSSYKVTPRTATVGVLTADPNAYNEIMAAIGTNSIDHVKNVAAALAAAAAPPAEGAPVQPPAEGVPAQPQAGETQQPPAEAVPAPEPVQEPAA
ncbi:MAG: VanW family protein [Lachnospiraceae bacterium]|nr:VanW family protein [Lachnospiraceae bacterium]